MHHHGDTRGWLFEAQVPYDADAAMIRPVEKQPWP